MTTKVLQKQNQAKGMAEREGNSLKRLNVNEFRPFCRLFR